MRNIKEYALLIMYSGEKEAIHQFRVEFKKLRAFVRLIGLDSSVKKKLKVPSKLKKIYKYAGSVRDLQIYYDHIIPFYNKKDGYPHQVLRHIAIAKCILLIALKYFHFNNVIKQMRQHIPDRVSKKRLERFIQKKTKAIDTLIATDLQDARLHVLKKQLKDVLYSLKIFHPPVQNYFPIAGKMSLFELNKLSDILNDYLDWVVGIALLDAALSARLSAHDKDILKGIRKKWRIRKAEALVLVKGNLFHKQLLVLLAINSNVFINAN